MLTEEIGRSATTGTRTWSELEAGLDHIRDSPKSSGPLRLIVRRPAKDTREVVNEASLDPAVGLTGDSWRARASRGADVSPKPDTQITLMNTRLIALIAGDESRWPLAGDQLYVDLDLRRENMPAGTQLQVGESILEIVKTPHTGCAKFVSRFGLDAMKFVNSPTGRALNLRGIYAKVVKAGRIRQGDVVTRLLPARPEATLF
jgi:hypothetical protein